jgi:lipoprotein-anchoring transpeptidase ErfK/SrfK
MRCHFLAVCGTGGLLLAATGVPMQAYEFQQIFGLPLAGMDGRPRAIAPPRELVAYKGRYAPGTIVISTEERRLYYVLPGNLAVKYGIGVGRPGFEWSGTREGCDEARMAVLDAALKDATPPSGSAAFPARRTGQSARCAGNISWRYVFSHPRLE